MSTYLLLRNNKQTGPFTIEEIKRLSLKSYDLVWVEGKSAAWRYPGEIPEFIAFAPPVPEQPFDRFYKKDIPESAAREVQISQPTSENGHAPSFPDQTSAGREEGYRESRGNAGRESVYINLSASEKNLPAFAPAMTSPDWRDPSVFPAATQRKAGKGLLITSIVLFFGAGLFTGFYISNRRSFYSSDGNPSQEIRQPIEARMLPEPLQEDAATRPPAIENQESGNPPPETPQKSVARSASRPRKKSSVPSSGKKDSLVTAAIPAPASKTNADSARHRQEAENAKAALAAKLKAHPEAYLPVKTGNYKTGLWGGISEIPVTVTNRSAVKIDLVVVAVDYILHNKKIFKTEYLNFHDLEPGAAVTLEAPKSPRGTKITSRLTIANSQQAGLSYSGPE